MWGKFALVLLTSLPKVLSVSITDIQGPFFQSPLKGQAVTNVTGVVVAKGPNGFWISGTPSSDIRVSHGLNVFTTSKTTQAKVNIGDLISVSGTVSEFKESSDDDNLFGTELDSPKDIVVISSNNTVNPIVLGKDRSPPTQLMSAFDKGPDGFLSVPNNQTEINNLVNATLQPNLYGLDFWASLEGQLVTVKGPVTSDFDNSFGEIFVYGDWPVTGKNSRGGLTMTFGPNGIPDATPETTIFGQPLDGTTNPTVGVGFKLSDVTGVVLYQFGFYYVMPLTAPTVIGLPSVNVAPTKITPASDECTLTIGDYNIDNFAPNSTTVPAVANHIANFLKGPDIMFVQEIQDNSGPTDDGTVIANLTLAVLTDAIANASNGAIKYDFLEIPPINDQDGGEPGGNIRQVYLFRPDRVKLAGSSPIGGSLQSTAVEVEKGGALGLTLNPGRIDPNNSAWVDSRKPLAAVWQSALPHSNGDRFFTVNLHLISKDGSSSNEGSARPPVNLGVQQRTSQVQVVSDFVNTILAKNKNANVIVGGDCNEFLMARSVFAPFNNILTDVDEIADLPPVERYTYVFDQNNEQLDHLFVSNAIKSRGVQVEHVHVNNWESAIANRASDHDPSVSKLKIC